MPSLTPRSPVTRLMRLVCGATCVLFLALPLIGCDDHKIVPLPPVPPTEIVGWSPLGTWSDDASIFTETITSDSAAFRVHWQATPLPTAAPGTGSLSVIFRSGDSGNPIINAVTNVEPGSGTVNVAAERPRWYYLDIQSEGVQWTVSVEEPIYGTR